MSVLFLVRHGQAFYQGAQSGELTEIGRQQARVLGEGFANTGRRFDARYAGSLPRQTETAELIAQGMGINGGLPLLTMPELNEHDTGAIIRAQLPDLERRDPSLRSQLTAREPDPAVMQRLLEQALLGWAVTAFVAPGVETWHQFTSRVREGLERISVAIGPNGRALVVTSGGPVAAAMQWALGLTHENAIRLEWRVRNASVSVFRIRPAGAELLSFNSTTHLESAQQRSLVTYL